MRKSSNDAEGNIPFPSAILRPDGEPHKIKVLIVDDAPKDLTRTVNLVRSMPILEAQITTAGNMAAAMFAAYADAFDALLIKDFVGAECGLDLAKLLRGDAVDVAVVLISERPVEDVATEARDAGVAACLSKERLDVRLVEDTLITTLAKKEPVLSAAMALRTSPMAGDQQHGRGVGNLGQSGTRPQARSWFVALN